MGKAYVIAGTPGTGKSTIGRKIAEMCSVDIVNLSTIAIEMGLISMYDDLRDTYVIDEEKLVEFIVKLAESRSGPLVIMTHYPEIIPKDLVEKIYVLRTHPLVLERRLEERGWKREKIYENVMAEILGVILSSAVEAFGEDRIYELDTTKVSPEEVAQVICNSMRGIDNLKPGSSIDWLSAVDPKEVARFKDYVGSEN
ncbi:MAG: adenylate kinase family protein [Desulfurococcaceae archaeon]